MLLSTPSPIGPCPGQIRAATVLACSSSRRCSSRSDSPVSTYRPRRLSDVGVTMPSDALDVLADQGLPDLELRHRRRARCEERIRIAKETGLRNRPLHGYAQNQVWCAIVTLASDLLAWMGMLALTSHDARRCTTAPVLHPSRDSPHRQADVPAPIRAGPLGPRRHRRDHPTRPTPDPR
jgi:hypothetical protein